jgi:VanZ family protein
LRSRKREILLAVWTIIILIAIAWPSPDIPEMDRFEYSDKIAHMILFGVFCLLLCRALSARGVKQGRAMGTSLLGASAYAGLCEVIQLFVPGRDCSLYDLYAGVIGALIALLYINFRKGRGAATADGMKG